MDTGGDSPEPQPRSDVFVPMPPPASRSKSHANMAPGRTANRVIHSAPNVLGNVLPVMEAVAWADFNR